MKSLRKLSYIFIALLCLAACGNSKKTVAEAVAVGPEFSADSAYVYCAAQCDFGPRLMNSEAHDLCGDWIEAKFRHFGMAVSRQETVVTGYDGTKLNCRNIIASFRPGSKERILLCAHWDSRPWATGPVEWL